MRSQVEAVAEGLGAEAAAEGAAVLVVTLHVVGQGQRGVELLPTPRRLTLEDAVAKVNLATRKKCLYMIISL